MLDNVLISIIITTHNGIDSLSKCVESAMSQDYPNFEVIVVDDNGRGSENQIKTENLLEPYMCCANFKYIAHQTNINGSAARNTGIKNANGKYIAFLDDDDVLHTNSIRLRYEKLHSMPSVFGIVFASFQQYYGNEKDITCVYSFEGDILSDYLQQKIHSPSSVLMIRREVVDTVGLWDESFYRHQDWEFVTRVLACFQACSIKEITVDRILTWRNNAKDPVTFETQRLFFLNKMKPYILSLNQKDQNAVYYRHYVDIGKNYLKFKNVGAALKWAKLSKHPARALFEYARSAFVFMKRRARR